MKNRPESKIKIPNSPGHHNEWVMAIKGAKAINPWDMPKKRASRWDAGRSSANPSPCRASINL